jgi:hypothetical protein
MEKFASFELDYNFCGNIKKYSKSYDFVPLPLQRYRDSPSATVTHRY